jgi:hypothetical protein
VREETKVYNTCAGYSYVQTRPTQGTDNFGTKGQYEDLDAFLNRADELAVSLLEQGITAMKIWPFDYAAERSSGYWIDADEGPNHGAGRAGTRARPATRDRATPGRRGAAYDAQRSLRHPPPVPAEHRTHAKRTAEGGRKSDLRSVLSRLTGLGCWLGQRTIAISHYG